MAESRAYFAIDTLSLDGGSMRNLFTNDVQGILKSVPDTQLVREHPASTVTRAGECLGAELRYPTEKRGFPNEVFFVCKNQSRKYAILLSLGARTKADLKEHYPHFLAWANAPQIVKDYKIVVWPD